MSNRFRPPFPLVLLRFWFWRILWLWFLIGSLIFVIQIYICAIAQDNEKIKLMLDMLERMPGFFKDFIGAEIMEVGNVSGFIAIGYQHPLVLISYMIFAVCVPTGLLTGHVQSGTMELILSRSVTKNQVYICASILTLGGMLALVMVMFAGTVVGTNICNFEKEVPLWPFFKASIVGSLLSAAAAGVSLLAAASFRNRGRAVGLTMAFFIVQSFIDLIADWWPRAKFLGPVSLFYYDTSWNTLLETGWPIRDMCVLSSVLVFSVVAGGIIWHRRDLPL
jgi:hypothetical protein